jgi:hypothetical protein
VTASSFFLALAVMGAVVAAILAVEIHSGKEDRKTRGLAAANRGLPDDGKGEGN